MTVTEWKKTKGCIVPSNDLLEATARCDSSRVSFSRFHLVSGGECFFKMADTVIVNINLENEVDIFAIVSKSNKTLDCSQSPIFP